MKEISLAVPSLVQPDHFFLQTARQLAVSETSGSKSCLNFFVFFFLAALINPFKKPFPTSNSAKFAPSIMLYNAYFALKFGWISIKFIHDSQ